ncbi:MAG: Wzt carbohydrate-binding domain-containing protein [Acidimicrobiia bacterium]|nr:Wzt carbohydrate-binding domain-containing protein [Acidimicrobiia bacterium]
MLDHGRLVAEGPPGEAIRSFREHLLQQAPFGEAPPADDEPPPGEPDEVTTEPAGPEPQAPPSQEEKRNFRIRILSVTMEHPGASDRSYLLPNEPLTVHVEFRAEDVIDDVNFGIAVHDLDGRLMFGSNTRLMEQPVGPVAGQGSVSFRFDRVPLLDGSYPVTIGITSVDEGTVYDWHEQRYRFHVMNPGQATGVVGLPVRIDVRSEAPTSPQGAR